MKAKIERNIAIIRKKTRFVALSASNRDKRSILFVLREINMAKKIL